MCTFGIFCGLSFSYILMTHATAPRCARSRYTRSGSPHNVMHSSSTTSYPTSLAGQTRAAHVWVGEFGPRQFAAICETMMSRAQNALLVVDDVHEQVSKQRVPPEFARLVNSGRNRGITSIWITPAPNLVSNNLLQSAHHIFAFPFALEGQVEWLAKNRLGPDAYALLPRQLRRRRPTIGADYDELPPHSYIYHYHASSRAQLHVERGGPNAEAAPGEAV